MRVSETYDDMAKAKMAEFCKPPFLFPDTNHNKTKDMEELFFILKRYFKMFRCTVEAVMLYKSTLPVSEGLGGGSGACHWQSSLDEWASIHPAGTGLLTPNNDKWASAISSSSARLTSYATTRPAYSEWVQSEKGFLNASICGESGALEIWDND